MPVVPTRCDCHLGEELLFQNLLLRFVFMLCTSDIYAIIIHLRSVPWESEAMWGCGVSALTNLKVRACGDCAGR
jgi:hypothetical protein